MPRDTDDRGSTRETERDEERRGMRRGCTISEVDIAAWDAEEARR